MAANEPASNQTVMPLKGSARTVTEFFEYSVHSILYQRGIYPAEDFETVKKWDNFLVMSIDPEVKGYIKRIMGQLHRWLSQGVISKVLLAITSKDTSETVEVWEFNVHLLEPNESGIVTEKPTEEIRSEIQAVIRQITASVTFLPVIDEQCVFNVQVCTNGNTQVPIEWVDTKLRQVYDAEELTLRSFTTTRLQVNSAVRYHVGHEAT